MVGVDDREVDSVVASPSAHSVSLSELSASLEPSKMSSSSRTMLVRSSGMFGLD